MKVKNIKKIALILVILTIFNIITPLTNLTVYAAKDKNGSIKKIAGGVLVESIKNLSVFLADCVLELMQNTMLHPNDIIVEVEPKTEPKKTIWEGILEIIIGILIISVAVVVTVYSFGTAAPALAAVLGGTAKIIGFVGVGTIIYGGMGVYNGLKGRTFDLPFIRYTPYEIFSGQVPMLDINFINPSSTLEIKRGETATTATVLYGASIEPKYTGTYDGYAKLHVFTYDFNGGNRGYKSDGKPGTVNTYAELVKAHKVGISYALRKATIYGTSLEPSMWENKTDNELEREFNFIANETYVTARFKSFMSDYYIYKNLYDSLATATHEYDMDYVVEESAQYDISGNQEEVKKKCIQEVLKFMKFFFESPRDDRFNDGMCIKGATKATQGRSGFMWLKRIDGVNYYIIIKNHGANLYMNYDDDFTTPDWPAYVLDDRTQEKANFYSAASFSLYIIKEEDVSNEVYEKYESAASILQKNISTWYKTLRRIALVGLLSILVYIGIRMMLCSTAQEKSKYKKMIVDWVAAICILYILHFLMAGIVTISSEISKIFAESSLETITVPIPETIDINKDVLDENGDLITKTAWSGSFVGYARLQVGVEDPVQSLTYAMIYIVLVVYTLMFTFTYLKRVLYMAFLTMIAPLIALTYPIDKIKDGNAQAFGLWIREYIFNALLQPVHLILYVMLIGNAMELAVDYPLYALIALGFMVPAEKFLRKMFGFEKAGTVSQLGAAAGGALLMNGLNQLKGMSKGIGGIGRRKGDKSEGENNQEGGQQVRTVNNPIVGGNGTDGNTTSNTATESATTRRNKRGRTAAERSAIRRNRAQMNSERRNARRSMSTSSASAQNTPANSNNQLSQILNSNANTRKGRWKKATGKVLGGSLRNVAKVTGGAILGGTGAMIGAAAGIATGDIGNVAKYGAIGGAAGGTIGSSLGNAAANVAGTGLELGKEGIQYAKDKKSGALEFKEQGIKDKSAIEAAQKLGLSPETAGTAYAISQRIPKEVLYDDKNLASLLAQSGADAKTQKQMLDYIKLFR